eukprot:CAMPEP_0202363652 /NCGR_PEP_ID=MMETSP1126-20121109/15356_1 /ASSEMBLY_ACC=CAM_ASM_000457 /TAXON_ID=3047 /ORGANISM="Dunaliella tertiolecta, Strain CCMP1320" /LENGTH=64 /DNA_ID=CAMNT_0048958101 /DNA_START=387 /DNA_END=581 /DNA_ORIENTATION=-
MEKWSRKQPPPLSFCYGIAALGKAPKDARIDERRDPGCNIEQDDGVGAAAAGVLEVVFEILNDL